MSLISNFARGVKVELIAKLVTSYEAFDGGTLIRGVAPHNIRDFFRKYGSTVRKFDHIADGDIYVGYVRMPGRSEFLTALILAGDNAVAVSFDSEVGESNDFLTLMAKKEFADRMTAAVQKAAALMRAASPPPPVSAQPTVRPASSTTPGPEPRRNDAMGWLVLICVAIVAVIVLVPMLSQRQPAASSGQTLTGTGAFDPATVPLASYATETDVLPQPDPRTGVVEGITFGMADSIMGGVDDFNAVYSEGGMTGAEARSAQCLRQAEASGQIHELDQCAAFDFTAQLVDEAVQPSHGFPLNAYFQSANARLDQAYSRYPEHSVERFAMIRAQTAVVLQDLMSRSRN
ncbi:MAG TPA: hypothetical protein DIV82_03840 [Brevundimonas diminuta]|nr:hypothetical protein [Brevundimonas diminuta]